MAITGLNYFVLRALRQKNVLADGADLIELGESNWYGDVPIQQFEQDIASFVSDSARRDSLLAELKAMSSPDSPDLYGIAKIYFKAIGGCATHESIDPGEPGSTYKLDLNNPVPLAKQYDLLVNYGTAEHVFNVFQFFKTAHDLIKPGGMMIHSAPMTGWVDHGFYNFQPTFFIDLARANGYEVPLIGIGQLKPLKLIEVESRQHIIELVKSNEIPANAMIEVVMRKPREARDFVAPLQGYYAGALSDEGRKAWKTLR